MMRVHSLKQDLPTIICNLDSHLKGYRLFRAFHLPDQMLSNLQGLSHLVWLSQSSTIITSILQNVTLQIREVK